MLLGHSAFLIGAHEQAATAFGQAYQRFLGTGDFPAAARGAAWCGFTLDNAGEPVRGPRLGGPGRAAGRGTRFRPARRPGGCSPTAPRNSSTRSASRRPWWPGGRASAWAWRRRRRRARPVPPVDRVRSPPGRAARRGRPRLRRGHAGRLLGRDLPGRRRPLLLRVRRGLHAAPGRRPGARLDRDPGPLVHRAPRPRALPRDLSRPPGADVHARRRTGRAPWVRPPPRSSSCRDRPPARRPTNSVNSTA